MSLNNNLPPQAYTRDTLSAAFNWLSRQPKDLQDKVKTSDQLVSLYLHSARRNREAGQGQLDSEAPVSSANFKEGLKHLAQGLKDFDSQAGELALSPKNENSQKPDQQKDLHPSSADARAKSAETVKQQGSSSASPNSTPRPESRPSSAEMSQSENQSSAAFQAQTNNRQNTYEQAPPPTGVQLPPLAHTSVSAPRASTETRLPPRNAASSYETESIRLDHRSLEYLRHTKERLNLSSESEALRLLITLGVEQIRTKFPGSGY